MRTPLSPGLASCVLLLPAAGCRPSADIANPEQPHADQPGACPPCATPKPPPGSPDDHEPPVILGARFIARDRVQLTFSEPLAPVEGVNPRQFRLSHAYSSAELDSGDRSYASGYYYDLAGDDYEQPLVFVSLERYEDRPEVLALNLNKPVPAELCDQVLQRKSELETEAEPSHSRRTGLFLHYTTRGSEGVRDQANNPLADVGADWALNFGTRSKIVYGSEPVMRLDLLPELACTDAIMRATKAPPEPT